MSGASQSARCDFKEDINERFMEKKKLKQTKEGEDVTGLVFALKNTEQLIILELSEKNHLPNPSPVHFFVLGLCTTGGRRIAEDLPHTSLCLEDEANWKTH